MPAFVQPTDEPIRVTSRGQWLCGGKALNNHVAELFRRHVAVRDDGSYAIVLGRQTQPIEVDDTPLSVRNIVAKNAKSKSKQPSGFWVEVSDGQREELDASTLMQSEDNVLYCQVVRNGFKVPCRFSASQYHELASLAEEGQEGFVIPLGKERYPIQAFEAQPKRIGDN